MVLAGAAAASLPRSRRPAPGEVPAGRERRSRSLGGSHGPDYVDGLLLAEVDTLLWWGFTDAERASEVAGELPGIRKRTFWSC